MVRALLPRIVAALVLVAATGCQDLLGLTPGHEATGGAGGTTGTTSTTSATTGGTSGTGGACGPDCEDTPCQNAACVDGQCVLDFVPAGTIADIGAPGDCLADHCDGEGNLLPATPEDSDAPSGECTWDACVGGLADHIKRRDGTHCKGGVCESGACVSATCDTNGQKDGGETDTDCGGPCEGCATGSSCLVDDDCQSGFCSTGKCESPLAVAATVKNGQLTFYTYRPDMPQPWTSQTNMTDWGQLGHVSIGFDAAGEAIAVARQGSAGALVTRWTAGVWKDPVQYLLSGINGAWLPAISATSTGQYLFAQNTNLQHHAALAATDGSSSNSFFAVGDAVSPFTGGAATRQGHISYFCPEGSTHLVERRRIGDGEWSAPKPVLDGDYLDAQPATATLPSLGTLVVAIRRQGIDHVVDWALVPDVGPVRHGTIPGLTFDAPAPPPRRLALAARADGGAILARKITKDAATLLEVWLADVDANGDLVWTPGYPDVTAITGEPAVSRGVRTPDGPRAEVLWLSMGNLLHRRLQADGTWSSITNVANTGALNSLAIAVP